MITVAARVDRGVVARSLQRFVWNHPEWWLLAVCAGAWILLGAGQEAMLRWPVCSSLPSPSGTGLWHRLWEGARSGSLASAMAQMAAMVVAMMAPLLVLPVRHAAFRSLWSRRNRSIAWVVAGYGAAWLPCALLAAIAEVALPDAPAGAARTAAGLAFALAALWQLTPAKRRLLAICHRSAVLAPTGWRAAGSCLRYGLSLGFGCLGSCWALMACAMVAGHQLAILAAATLIAFVERHARQPPMWLTAGGLALAATASLF